MICCEENLNIVFSRTKNGNVIVFGMTFISLWKEDSMYKWRPKRLIYRYIMFGMRICEKYQSRDEKFPEPNGEGNLASRLVFFTNTHPKHDISV